MNINKVLNNPRLAQAILGVSRKEFLSLLETFEQILYEHRDSKNRKRIVGGGAKGNIKSAQQKLFYILFYIKNYPTYDTAAFIFGSSKSRTHGWTQAILPLLEKTLGRKVVLPQRQLASPEEFFRKFPGVKEVMIDGVERPTHRPKKEKTQKKHYSGKKKRHTRKNIVMTDPTKKILVLTPSKHGKVHDKRLTDKNILMPNIPKDIDVYTDTGFLGVQKEHGNVFMPKKKPRNGFLTQEEKEINKIISFFRIGVEHAIGGMKRFRCVSDTYRNRNGIDDGFALVSAGLWNFHLEMQG